MVISDYYKELDDNEKINFRNMVISETGLSYPAFYKKIRENSFTKPEEFMINHLINSQRNVRKY